MSIYGNMLLAFPEQKTTTTVYDMTPKINGGYEIVTGSNIEIKCVYQHTGGKKLQDNNGNLVEYSGLELWTVTTGLNGKFTQIENTVYRLNSDNDWHKEGGFVRYGLEKVVGNNGTEPTNTAWNIGTNSFS